MPGTVFVSEYHLSTTRGAQMLKAPPVRVQTPILAGGAAQSFQPFGPMTEAVRVSVDGVGPVCIQWGTNPSATTNDERWAANQTEHRAVAPGDTLSIIVSPT